MRPVERTSEYSRVLRYIYYSRKALTCREIAEGTGILQRNVSRILSTFHKNGLLEREGKKRSFHYKVNQSAVFTERL